MQKPIYIVVIAILIWGCQSKHPNEGPNQKSRAQIDSLSRLLDDTPDEPTAIDSLPRIDYATAQTDVAYSKYLQYRKAVPIPGIRNNAFAMIEDNSSYAFLNPAKKTRADSLIKEIPDTLVSKKQQLINKMLDWALRMDDRQNFGLLYSIAGKKIRNGIKYGWGSKDYKKKLNPLIETKGAPKESHCDQYITGLDCSGFIYQLYIQSGIRMPERNAEDMRQKIFLQHVLNPYFKYSRRFSVQDFHNLPWDKVENGDIIYNFNYNSKKGKVVATHIGIALSVLNKLRFFNSSGASNSCDYNISNSGGITYSSIKEYLQALLAKKNGYGYGVVRYVISPH